MFNAPASPYLAPFDGSFRVAAATTSPPQTAADKKELKKLLAGAVDAIAHYQAILYAHDYHSLLLIFQAMDAAGKDSTIRAVLSGVNPAGCQVFSFKQPSAEELDHDFLWRTSLRLPERGRIGVFNRSYYEEVLAVRVHPELLKHQRIEPPAELSQLWTQRLESIADHERHLARNGTVVMKFWLNVSRDEQKRRFLSRLDEPEKNWKFSDKDVAERRHWDDYMRAYEAAIAATSKPWAPWYAIPADSKPYMRATVAGLIQDALASLNLSYPSVAAADLAKFDSCRRALESEDTENKQ